jgi:c-di-GMP-related signal transduction protein
MAGASHFQGFYFSRPIAAEAARKVAAARFLADPSEPEVAYLETEMGNGTQG